MRVLVIAIIGVIMINIAAGEDIIGDLLKKIGVGTFFGNNKSKGSTLPVSQILPNPNAVDGDSRIEELTEALTSGARESGESCFTRNIANKNITAIKVLDAKKALLDCDEQWLRYRLLKKNESAKGEPKSEEGEAECLVKERTNENVWRDDYQYRHVLLPKDKDYREIKTPVPGIKCRSGTSRARSHRYLNAQKQICIDMRRAVENKCHSCRLIAMVKEPHRSNVANCIVDHLDHAYQFARPALRYCICMEQADEATFPVGNCKENEQPETRTRKPAGLFGGLVIKPPVTEAEKKSLPWLGACMSTDFGTGPSCLLDNKEGRRVTTVTPELMRKKLVECERNTLRYLVDKQSGCTVRVPGIGNVWQTSQQYHLETTVPKEDRRRYKVIKNDLFKCGKDEFEDNKRNLNIFKQMCVEAKSLIMSKCDLCQLKTLIDDTQAKAVFECTNDRLPKAGDNAQETVQDCMRKVEAQASVGAATVC